MSFMIDGDTLIGYCGKDPIVIIPNNIVTISDRAFFNNQGIEKVLIPSSVTRIENSAFENCCALCEVIFEKLTPMNNGSHIFHNCPNLRTMSFPDWESFWNFSFDGEGPLVNGTELYIDNKVVSKAIIAFNANRIDNLYGAKGITGLTTDNGDSLVRLDLPAWPRKVITTQTLAKELFGKYPGLQKMVAITGNTSDILKGLDGYGDYSSFEPDSLLKQVFMSIRDEFDKARAKVVGELCDFHMQIVNYDYLMPGNIIYASRLIDDWRECIFSGTNSGWQQKEQAVIDDINKFTGKNYSISEWRNYVLSLF